MPWRNAFIPSNKLNIFLGIILPRSQSKMAPKVLVVLTSQDKIPANNQPTGWYLVSGNSEDSLGPLTDFE